METIHCENGNTVQWFAASTPQGMRGIVQVWREGTLWVTIPTYDFCTARAVAKLLADDYNKQQTSPEFVVDNEALIALVATGEPVGTIEKRLLEAFGGGPEFR